MRTEEALVKKYRPERKFMPVVSILFFMNLVKPTITVNKNNNFCFWHTFLALSTLSHLLEHFLILSQLLAHFLIFPGKTKTVMKPVQNRSCCE